VAIGSVLVEKCVSVNSLVWIRRRDCKRYVGLPTITVDVLQLIDDSRDGGKFTARVGGCDGGRDEVEMGPSLGGVPRISSDRVRGGHLCKAPGTSSNGMLRGSSILPHPCRLSSRDVKDLPPVQNTQHSRYAILCDEVQASKQECWWVLCFVDHTLVVNSTLP
jgi:hypothetical protein